MEHEQQTAEADLVYRLEDKPPFFNALISAITHLLAIFVPMVTPALIVGGLFGLYGNGRVRYRHLYSSTSFRFYRLRYAFHSIGKLLFRQCDDCCWT